MQLKGEQLGAHLARELKPVYLVYGDEPLLVIEAGDAIRAAARKQGFDEREVLTAISGFDWNQLAMAAGNLSLFGGRKLIDLRIPTGKPGREGSAAIQDYCQRCTPDTLLLENEPGALSRVVGLFSQRNYNIESLTVAATEDPSLSRLTLTTIGQDDVIEQITKNLNKLIEVVKLVNLSESAHIERELMLVKVKATGAQRAEIKRTTDIFRGQIVDVTSSVYTIQLAGTSDKLDSFIQAIGTTSILETVRTGVTGIARGDKVLSI